ncbi:MAG: MFS transporter, partial [Acetobacteraceae bacterium]
GRISGLAWGAGYAGGLVCLGLCLLLLIEPHPPLFGLSADRAEPVRATALFAAGWIALFAWPIMVVAPSSPERLPWRVALRNGLAALWQTVGRAWRDLTMRQFLIARMLYTDGLNTLFAFGAIFAAGSFGMDVRETLLLGIALNITAGLGALCFAFVEDRIGPKPTIMISLVALTVLGILVLFAHSATLFWVLALGLGVFVGPAQAASRSLMAQLSPPNSRNAYFGLYALSGRVTGFLGPTALGLVTAATASQRAGMAVVVLLVVAGGLLLAPLDLRPTI